MDVGKLFVKVYNLKDYIDLTKDVSSKYKTSKIQLNMSTVLSLKKARYLEIEYFNECNGRGAAFIIIERLLEVCRSKTWGLLGKELVSLLQHWLDSTRKHLIIINKNWWSFMTLILEFIKELRQKDTTLPDLLVESTAEHLLDLATRAEVGVLQRLDILYCLNLCCADSSREVRFATRHHLEHYFVKLSALLASCGHVPAQYHMLETLLRWLLPRQNAAVRRAAADSWFPDHLYGRDEVDIFLERQWLNFYMDARDFLNAHNQAPGLPASVVYRRLTAGSFIMESSPKRESWLDINPATNSITVLLEPRVMDTLGLAAAPVHTLVVDGHVVTHIQLAKVASEVTITIKTSHPLHVYPSDLKIGDGGDVTVVISKLNDMKRMDYALKKVFGEKYEVLIDFEEVSATSPQDRNKKIVSSSEEDTRFSQPVRPTRRKVSGYVTKSASTWKSPSTASTTSLALLHDRLEALPKFRFNKEPVKVAALPDLSIVSELTEVIDTQSVVSGTSNNRSYRGGFKSLKKSERKSRSDGETYKSKKKYVSPIVGVKEHNPSCLLVATIGSDESVINETIECLSKNKNFETNNIVDLLLKEALQSKDDKLDSGINTGENRKSPELRDSDAIEDTPNLEQSKSFRNKNVTVPKDDESEECNEIDESQFEYVSVRKKVLIDKHKEIEEDIQNGKDTNEMPTFDEEAVEKFFSEHIAEDRSGGIVVSPTLARKINETSSEASDNFQDCLIEDDFPCAKILQVEDVTNSDSNIQDAEIIDCLNNIIDKVCLDIEKCKEILEKDNSRIDIFKMSEIEEVERKDDFPNRVLANIENLDSVNKNVVETPKKKPKQKTVIKLKFKTKKALSKTPSQKQNKTNLASKMSPIPESKDSIETEILDKSCNEPQIINVKDINPQVSKTIDHIPAQVTQVQPKENAVADPGIKDISPKSIDSDTPLIRRRRKLYSPKDEQNKPDIQIENTEKHESEVHYLQDDDEADFKSESKKTPKYAATCYKDIEKARKRHIRLPRSKKSKVKTQTRSPSPRTKKIRHFDILKTNVEEHVDIILSDNKISPSPRTKKINDLFDNLKTNVEEHDNIILADKKFNDEELAIYNFTSDSEDEDFKKKKVEMRKRISTTTNASGDSTVSRHGRIINKINYSERSSDEKTKTTKAKNIVKRKKARQRKPYNLADEKMRADHHEDLNTSLVLTKDSEVLKEPELILEAPPQMEDIGGQIEEPAITVSRFNKAGKKKKKITVKKETKRNFDEKIDNDDRTISPLPGLVIEKMPTRKDDPNDSVCTPVMDKLKKIYQEGPDAVDESNTTQNLLLDVEKDHFSQHLYITNDFDRISLNNPITAKSDTNDANPKTRGNDASDNENVIHVINYEENTGKASGNMDSHIINISDVQSEKSIATVGTSPINAHGNIDEEPPDKMHLTKRVQSRELETEDMDNSIKDYYRKLREEINKPMNSSASSPGKLEIDLTENITKQCISPNVKIQSMSKDNTLRWLPERKSGESRINILENGPIKSISPVVSLNKISYDDISVWKPTKDASKKPIDLVEESSNGSQKSVSPVVCLTRMTYDDFSKWLFSGRTSCESSTHSSEKSKLNEEIKDMSEKSFLRPMSNENVKQLRSVSRNRSKELNASSKCSSNEKITIQKKTNQKTIKLHYNLRSAPKPISSIKKIEADIDCNNNDYNRNLTGRKTLISPIKLFHELSEDNAIPQATDKLTKTEVNRTIEVKSPILNISASKRYDLKKSTIGSCESNTSSSNVRQVDERIPVRGTIKRKSDSPVKVYGKKKRIEVLTESGPSLDSVDDWLKKNAPNSAAKSVSDSYGENLQNIMEKLDTTLAEIHQNTSKNFVHLFVEAHRHLATVKDERRRALKQVASDVLKHVVSVLDSKFEELDKRNQEIDTEFMEQLKQRATEFIREDCKRKQAMVSLLKEDIEATVNRDHSQTQLVKMRFRM